MNANTRSGDNCPPQVRAQLLRRRDELRDRAERTNEDLRRTPDLPVVDVEERAAARQNDEVLEGIKAAARAELGQIEAALERIEQGHYGICAGCGGAIEAGRLEAVPTAQYCSKCAGGAQ
jgi:RNA polymerase-binding protein DksA